MGLWEQFQKFWFAVLAVLGIGAVTYMTLAWPVPATDIYIELVPNSYTWAHDGSTQYCYFEIHPNASKTINSVSFKVNQVGGSYVVGDASTWVAGTQNTSDWLIWRSPSFTASAGTWNCTVRVIQNEFPGTSEHVVSRNFTTIGNGLTGCLGSPDCTIGTHTLSTANTTYKHRSITIQSGTLSVTAENITLSGAWKVHVASTGAISISNPTPALVGPYPAINFTINTHNFTLDGTISGKGQDAIPADSCVWQGYGRDAQNGMNLNISAQEFNGAGTIDLSGGAAAQGQVCCGTPFHSFAGFAAGTGGKLYISLHPMFNNSYQITLKGGAGANANGCCGTTSGVVAAVVGGRGGYMNITTLNLTNTGVIDTRGGVGGAGVCACDCGINCAAGANGGAGNNTSVFEVTGNISVSNYIYASGGAGGADAGCGAGSTGTAGLVNVSYCANGTSMDWSKFSPAAANQTITCEPAPATAFVVPNSTTNVVALLSNISVNVTPSDTDIYWMIEVSPDNGTTWLPAVTNPVVPIPNSTNATPILDTHRLGSQVSNYTVMRAYSYNSTSEIFSPWVYSSRFNLSAIPTAVAQTSTPSGIISTASVLFECNYTNTTASVQAATTRIMIDGVLYNMSYNETSGLYYYVNNNTWTAGPHYWNCVMSKANYISYNGTNTSINLSGYGVYINGPVNYVKFTCPFPTVTGMTPAGQKAGIGIFRVQNYNTTSEKNYTIELNNTVPTGITVYARSDRYVAGSPTTGWTTLTDAAQRILTDVNDTNASAYIWLRMDCASVIPGTYSPFGYNISEE